MYQVSSGDFYHNDEANNVALQQRYNVQSGCSVSAQGTPNMTLNCASGLITFNGSSVSVTADSALVISAAHATKNRYDLVVVNANGVYSVIEGTATAADDVSTSLFPPTYDPSVYYPVARIYVGASVTSITSSNITDLRLFRVVDDITDIGEIKTVADLGVLVSGTNTDVDSNKLIDSTATFVTDGVKKGMIVFSNSANLYYDAEIRPLFSGYDSSNSYLRRTHLGKIIPIKYATSINFDAECTASSTNKIDLVINFIGADGVTIVDTQTVNNVSYGSYSNYTVTNDTPSAELSRIEIFSHNSNGNADEASGYIKNISIVGYTASKILSIDSETQLTLANDIFTSSSTTYTVSKTRIKAEYEFADGRTITDTESVEYGNRTPCLIGKYLMYGLTANINGGKFGTSISGRLDSDGAYAGNSSDGYGHYHDIVPTYFTLIPIVKIK